MIDCIFHLKIHIVNTRIEYSYIYGQTYNTRYTYALMYIYYSTLVVSNNSHAHAHTVFGKRVMSIQCYKNFNDRLVYIYNCAAYEIDEIYPKRIEEVVEAPGDDDIVVESNEEGHDAGGNAYATEPRVNRVPDTESTLTHSLTKAQFDQEERNPLQNQHHEEGNEESTCEIVKRITLSFFLCDVSLRDKLCVKK